MGVGKRGGRGGLGPGRGAGRGGSGQVWRRAAARAKADERCVWPCGPSSDCRLSHCHPFFVHPSPPPPTGRAPYLTTSSTCRETQEISRDSTRACNSGGPRASVLSAKTFKSWWDCSRPQQTRPVVTGAPSSQLSKGKSTGGKAVIHAAGEFRSRYLRIALTHRFSDAHISSFYETYALPIELLQPRAPNRFSWLL